MSVAGVPGAGPFDLSVPRRLHVVGAGGVGMSAITTVLAQMGHRVSGSDLKPSPALERLELLGVMVHLGHDPGYAEGVDAVIVSSAIGADNAEVVAAGRAGTPVLRRAQALAAIVSCRRTVAVSGTHGKTTTTSMLATVLVSAGLNPSFVVGGELNEVGAGAAWDRGEWLVVEADESDGTFLELAPEVAVVTNVAADHLDYFGSMAGIEAAFRRFLTQAPLVVVNADDPVAARLAAEAGAVTGAVTVGHGSEPLWRVVNRWRGREGARFTLARGDGPEAEMEIAVPGAHNVANAALAAVVALEMGLPVPAVQAGLASFAGVARRFQYRGTLDGVTYIDDYAHNPGKVRAAVATAAEGGWNRVVAVFQPHRYSRTAAQWSEFATAFAGADVVVVTGVYPAGEAPLPGVSGRLVADAVAAAAPPGGASLVRYVPERAELAPFLSALLRPGDVCLVLGAGDVGGVVDELLGPSWA